MENTFQEYITSLEGAEDIIFLSDSFLPALQNIEDNFARSMQDGLGHGLIVGYLEHWCDNWESDTEEGILENSGIVPALRALFSLPSFDPDSWIKRRFLIRGLTIFPKDTDLPTEIKNRYVELISCFIYGHFHSCFALSRSIVEIAFKTKFPAMSNSSLGDIINKKWFEEPILKNNEEMREKIRIVAKAGNQVLHASQEKVKFLIQELNAKRSILDTKATLEFLFTPEN
jgi:hypothetical protein